ncbi:MULTISPECIES: site-specific integrase [unclassified Streptomyces]|uniref:site-specific integrase n=1 Tax=unclassified Streptomyces TaxID=2593676 RepID=UPI000823ECDB|nr:site-specific integrase [Streptomyces sp. AmelKG-E11A]SCK62360.1 Site-specific recombinase XerD [Streptomyces sp. AmelKG-E11A]
MLIDGDLRFEDGPAVPRPTAVVNRWLRELPASGAPAPSSWENYARVVKEWMEFLAEHGVGLFDSRVRLKAGLSRYAEHRAAGPLKARFAATTWGQHVSILSLFYRWAINEEYTTAEPFTYRAARALFAGTGREVKVNLAVRRTPKPHATVKYLEPDFTELFRRGLRGLAPDGSQDTGFHGRELTRNGAVGDHALATGMRLQWFTYLLPWEIPALPPEPTAVPIPFPVPAGITKGKKFRTTWTSYEALAGLYDYLDLDRAATTEDSLWRPPRRWGEPLMVSESRTPGRADHRAPTALGVAESGRAASSGRPGGRFVLAGGEEQRRPVHGLGHGLRADIRPDSGPFPACLAPPMSPHFLDEDLGIPGHRALPAGRETRAGHRCRRRPGLLPE